MFARCSYACLSLALFSLACLPVGVASAQEDEPQKKASAAAEIQLEVDEGALGKATQQAVQVFQVQSQATSLKSWIGLALAPADETLRAQLGLDEETGVVVTAVVDGSPAAEAGVKKHDILVSVGDAPVSEAADVIKAAEAADEKPMTLTVLRGGEKTTLEVTPEKRRAAEPIEIEFGGEDGLTVRNLAQYLVRPGAIVQAPLHVTQGRARIHLADVGNLPKNLTISITKTGTEPAQIVVKRDDEKWEVTEEQLEKLPEDVRPHVDRMLGRPPRMSLSLGRLHPRAHRESLKQRKATLNERRATLKQRIRTRDSKIHLRRAGKADAQQRLDALSEQVEQLQRTIEELRRDLPDGPDGTDESQ